jgi:hypothetical protein
VVVDLHAELGAAGAARRALLASDLSFLCGACAQTAGRTATQLRPASSGSVDGRGV